MKYRAFIRFSLDNDDGTLTTYLSNLLVQHGFAKVGTGEYQADNLTVQQVAAAMLSFYAAVGNPQQAFSRATLPQGVRVDHIWTHSGSY